MTAEIVALQSDVDAPQSGAVASGTNLVLPPIRTTDRLAHFPEEVYDLSAESHLARFVKVLLGDAGIGQARKRLLIARMQQSLQGTHFYNLDRFYGSLFGVQRSAREVLDIDPFSQTATGEQWTRQHAKDASYRSRVTQFARAIGYGATPTGMELVAEALLAADCEVYEAYIQADAGYQTYAEIEARYPTYADLEGVSYSTLEGTGLGQMAGDARREFVVRPKRAITQAEAYDLTKVLSRIKPADARFSIDTSGVEAYDLVAVRGAVADSTFWEVIPKVIPRTGLAVNPYQVTSTEPVEQPRPPFTGYQGEAWSYVGDVIGVSAYTEAGPLPTERVVLPDGSFLDYDVHSAMLPKRHILAGRSVSDGVLVSHPYWAQSRSTFPDLAPLYTDRVPLDRLNALLRDNPAVGTLPPNPAERFWATPQRDKTDLTREIMELRLTEDRLVNHLSLEIPHFPHDLLVQAWLAGGWTTVATQSIFDSVPQYLPPGRQSSGHPQHSHPGHWIRLDINIAPIWVSRLRLVQVRNGGTAPLETLDREVRYSLGLRSVNPGYRVLSLDDAQPDSNGVIGATTDAVGSTVEFTLRQEEASNLLAGEDLCWRSEPQPVNFAVVSLYLDVRDGSDDAQVIERFFLDPTHAGAHLSIYWTEAVGEPSQQWYEQRVWTPIPRDYTLQKGYVHIPPTRARHFKFEFTSLTPEPFESFLPLVRTVRLFPRALVREVVLGTSDAAYPPGFQSEMNLARTDTRYADALDSLSDQAQQSRSYAATEALYALSPAVNAEASARSWIYGWQPWHQGAPAPRFADVGPHVYETVELRHTTKIGFFVGLYDIQAFAVNPGADDDSPVYLEHFHDFRQIEAGFTWTFNPNALMTDLSSDAVATSRVYASRHSVVGLQFATQQSDPEQLVPDDDFRDPALGATDWTDDGSWHRTGDGILVYNNADHSVTMVRYSEPLLRPPVAENPGLIQPVVSEVFATRPAMYVDSESTAGQQGGIESPLLGASSQGRAYAAVRLTFLTSVEEPTPMRLQIVHGNTREVLSELTFTGRQGETVEKILAHDLAGQDPVRVRLVQAGVSDNQVKIHALSLFDEGILWEFSTNGGADWVPAISMRNNADGILTFPEPGNQLVWRVRGLRPRMAVTALKMRPQYQGIQNARDTGAQRGPNVSVYDADVPIQDDPMFTNWTRPVPRWWYAAYKRYPKLPVEGAPNVTEFARFYGRPVEESGLALTEAGTRMLTSRRSANQDWITPAPATAATRTGTFGRVVPDAAPVGDYATAFKVAPQGGVVNRVIHPV